MTRAPTLLLAAAFSSASLLAPVAALAQQPKASVQGAPKSMSGMALSNKEPIQIESDDLKINDKEHIATFTGNVKVVQGDVLLRSGKMVVHYSANGGSVTSGTSQIEKIDVSDKVYLKSGEQEATADKGTYVMDSQLLTLSGDQVVLTQGKNVFVGCKLIVHVATSEANLQSCGKRVMIQLDPKSQQQQQQKNK
ncbi:MAG: LptA/OstA family protein [Pararhizobium sp.]